MPGSIPTSLHWRIFSLGTLPRPKKNWEPGLGWGWTRPLAVLIPLRSRWDFGCPHHSWRAQSVLLRVYTWPGFRSLSSAGPEFPEVAHGASAFGWGGVRVCAHVCVCMCVCVCLHNSYEKCMFFYTLLVNTDTIIFCPYTKTFTA